MGTGGAGQAGARAAAPGRTALVLTGRTGHYIFSPKALPLNDFSPGDKRIYDRLSDYQQHFDELFQEYFSSLRENIDRPPLSRFAPNCLSLLQEISLRGGKRQRAAFVYEAAGLVTDKPLPGLDAAALSIELLHVHGLILDDIIDDAPTRRGGPSTYYAYQEEFPEHERTALGLTLLAGDLAAFLSLHVLLDSKELRTPRQVMIEVQVRAATATIFGQMFDLERDMLTTLPSVDMLNSISDYKSSRYSALAPLQLGLLVAGEQPSRFEEELRRYALFVGICGQMRDDYLGLYGSETVTGKPTDIDIQGGRRTYAIRTLLSGANDAERALVESALGDPDCSVETVDKIREIGQRQGADRKLLAQMQRYAEMACQEASSWRPRWRDESVTFFERIPVWGVERLL